MNKACQTLLWLCAVLWCGRMVAALPADSPVINSISVVETNLYFIATFPPGVDHAVLEMRPTLAGEWQSAALLNVPTDGGTIEFAIPTPALETAFFRLNASLLVVLNNSQTNNPTKTTATNQVSAELQYVAVPPMGPDSTNTNEAVFHFKGMIDGSDRITIRRQGALWEHVNWGWPAGVVTVNGSQWNPSEKNFITTTGAVMFLPQQYSLLSPRLELVAGRDVVALERTSDALMVYLDDTPPGAAPYEFKIHFPRGKPEPATVRRSTPATLKITALIDGSDLLKITASEATWMHRAWAYPEAVRLNDIPWNVRQTNLLANIGTNRFLPSGVNFSTAKIVERKGRDLATMWADNDAIWVNFADNPNGADDYELDISFGRQTRPVALPLTDQSFAPAFPDTAPPQP
jgi:hypothetical protein